MLQTDSDLQGAGQAYPAPVAYSEQDWMKMIAESPLFKAVNDIEEMVKDGISPQGVLGAKGRPYIDIKVSLCLFGNEK